LSSQNIRSIPSIFVLLCSYLFDHTASSLLPPAMKRFKTTLCCSSLKPTITANPSSIASNEPNPNLNPTVPPPPLLHLVEKPDRGRAVIANSLIKPGQVVMVDPPLLVYPSSLGCLPIFCSCCFRVLPSEPFRCPTCSVARFCSEQCRFLSHPHLLCYALPSLIKSNATWPDDMIFLLTAYSLPSNKFIQLLSLRSNSSFPDELIDKLHSELAALFPDNIVPLHFSRENTCSLISKEKK
jgi:hypothetical protein